MRLGIDLESSSRNCHLCCAPGAGKGWRALMRAGLVAQQGRF